MAKKELTYSKALKQLAEIVHRIENDDPDIDELNTLVKEAGKLVLFCRTRLKSTEEELKKNLEALN